MNEFVSKALGLNSISGITFSFKQLYKDDSQPQIPILFITSQGSDPSKELEEYAEKEIGRENFIQLSMGGNQNEIALNMIREVDKYKL